MRREDQVPVMAGVRYFARVYQKGFSLEKLFADRGSQPLQVLYHQRSTLKQIIDTVDVSGDMVKIKTNGIPEQGENDIIWLVNRYTSFHHSN